MKIKSLFVTLGKLLFCGIVNIIGVILEGMFAALMNLLQPTLSEGTDGAIVSMYFFGKSTVGFGTCEKRSSD